MQILRSRVLISRAQLGSHSGYRFQGYLDEVVFYDRALSAAEIVQLATGLLP